MIAAAGSPAATTRPATAPAEENPALTQGIIKLTGSEWMLWKLTSQRPSRFWEDILFVMLSKTAALPPLTEEQFEELDRPAYKGLVSDPDRYVRLPVRPIRVAVRVVRVERLLSGKGMPRSEHWPADKPVWQIQCLYAEARTPLEQPLTVLSTVDPTGLLPKPSEEGEEDGVPYVEYRYTDPSCRQLPLLEPAGIFYKTRKDKDRSPEKKERDYPIVLAWQLARPAQGKSGTGWVLGAILAGILVLAAALFWFLQRSIRGIRKSRELMATHRALHDRPKRPEDEAGAEDDKSSEIDPELRAAVEQYRKEKQGEHGQDDKS